MSLDLIRDQLPDYARDLKLNLGSVLETLKGKARALGCDLAPLIVSGELRSYLPV